MDIRERVVRLFRGSEQQKRVDLKNKYNLKNPNDKNLQNLKTYENFGNRRCRIYRLRFKPDTT